MKILRYLVEIVLTAVQDLVRRPTPSILSIATMTVAVTVLGGFLVLTREATAVMKSWSDRATIEAYLESAATAAEIERIERVIEQAGVARQVVHVASEQVLSEFRALYPRLQDVEELLAENPFPASLRVVADAVETERIAALAAELADMPGVASVRYDREWLASLDRFGDALAWFAAAGTVALLLAALVTIGSVVRLALDDKKDEIRLLRLSGAPAPIVVAPLLVAGGLLGGLGGFCALLALGLLRTTLTHAPVASLINLWGERVTQFALPLSMQAALVVVAVAAGALAAGVAGAREAMS